jgi:hypothetical protein
MMNNRTSVERTVIATLLLAASGIAGSAQAAAVSGTAEVFGVITSGAANVSFSNDFFTQDARTSSDPDNFSSGTVAQDIVLGGTPFAESSFSTFNLPRTSAGVVGQGSASSLFQWSFDYTASGSGHVNVDVEYNFNVTVINLGSHETAGVSALVNVMLDGTSNQREFFRVLNNENGQLDGNAHLVLGFDVVDGQHGSITVTAASQAFAAPVPLPPTLLSLLSAGLGLLGYARRRI